jgi:hypothetical protein
MKLVRSGSSGMVQNGRAHDLAAAASSVLSPILGDELAREVSNNAAMAFAFDEDEIYEPDMSFADTVREALVQRLRHPKVYRAEHLTPDMIEEAVMAIKEMDNEGLGEAVMDWFTEPINEYETPYVPIPEDFTPAEQTEFVNLVRQPRFVSREEQLAKLKEIIGRRAGLSPNRRRATTLNGRPSMDTSHVGREVDPDRYKGARGKHLEAAMDRYETFHAKRPLRTVELPHDLPTSVVPVGQVISTMYRTDKWHEDGDDEDYKHVHDNSRGGKEREYEFGKGVIAYEPASQASESIIASDGKRTKTKTHAKPVRLPVSAPKALSLLGYCLGVFVQRFDDEEIYEINPRGCYLFCSPKGDMLALYSPEEQPDGSNGFLMIMAGGGLRVLKDGIDG